MSAGPTAIEVFYCYAYEDEALCRELEKHLIALQRLGLISSWHSRRVVLGTNWAEEIDAHVNSASLILLLVSPGFLRSGYCYGIEMKRALERHKAGVARVIPMVVRALAAEEQQLGGEHNEAATNLNTLAVFYHCQGRDEEAERLYVRALAIKEQQLGTPRFDTAQSFNNLALLYKSQGKYREAELLYVYALGVQERQWGANHPDMAIILNNLAALYQNQGKCGEAEQLYVRALGIKEQRLGAGHPDTAISLNNLALLYKSQGKYAEAKPLLRRALTIYERQLGAGHPHTRVVRGNSLSLLRTIRREEEVYGERRQKGISEHLEGPGERVLV